MASGAGFSLALSSESCDDLSGFVGTTASSAVGINAVRYGNVGGSFTITKNKIHRSFREKIANHT